MCYEYSVTDNKITCIISYELSCADYEEADTKIIIRACQQNEDSSITIRTSDLVLILLANMDFRKQQLSLDGSWSWQCMPIKEVTALHKKIVSIISKALPALHAFTGCDFNPALYQRENRKPLKFVMNSEIFQKAFLDLRPKEHNVQDYFNIINSFTCYLNGCKS